MIGDEILMIMAVAGFAVFYLIRSNRPVSWSILVVFSVLPFIIRSSLQDYSGNDLRGQFLIRWLVHSVIFGGITFSFIKLCIPANTLSKDNDDDSSSPNDDFEDFGDKTISVSNRYFLIAWEELEQNSVDKIAWAQAIAASAGDENKTKAIYIRLRVKELAARNID